MSFVRLMDGSLHNRAANGMLCEEFGLNGCFVLKIVETCNALWRCSMAPGRERGSKQDECSNVSQNGKSR